MPTEKKQSVLPGFPNVRKYKFQFWLSVLVSKNNKTHKVKICHSERSIAESKNLRISLIFAVKSVPRSFDSLRSLRMTTAFVVILLFVLIKADNHDWDLAFCLQGTN